MIDFQAPFSTPPSASSTTSRVTGLPPEEAPKPKDSSTLAEEALARLKLSIEASANRHRCLHNAIFFSASNRVYFPAHDGNLTINSDSCLMVGKLHSSSLVHTLPCGIQLKSDPESPGNFILKIEFRTLFAAWLRSKPFPPFVYKTLSLPSRFWYGELGPRSF